MSYVICESCNNANMTSNMTSLFACAKIFIYFMHIYKQNASGQQIGFSPHVVGPQWMLYSEEKQIHFHVCTPFGYHFRIKLHITLNFENNITIKYHLEYYQWPSKISLQFRLNSMKLENYFIVKDEIRHGKLFIACLKEPYCDPLFDHKVVAVERLLSPWHSHTILFQRITIPNKNSCQVRWNWRSLLTFVYLSIPWIILRTSSDMLLST